MTLVMRKESRQKYQTDADSLLLHEGISIHMCVSYE
jgi:hypothetical protein